MSSAWYRKHVGFHGRAPASYMAARPAGTMFVRAASWQHRRATYGCAPLHAAWCLCVGTIPRHVMCCAGCAAQVAHEIMPHCSEQFAHNLSHKEKRNGGSLYDRQTVSSAEERLGKAASISFRFICCIAALALRMRLHLRNSPILCSLPTDPHRTKLSTHSDGSCGWRRPSTHLHGRLCRFSTTTVMGKQPWRRANYLCDSGTSYVTTYAGYTWARSYTIHILVADGQRPARCGPPHTEWHPAGGFFIAGRWVRP